MGSSVRVVDIGRDDWRELRALRLEMLRDTPMAYIETVQQAEALGPGEWAFRAARCGQPGSLGVAAVEDDTGQWVGTMSAYLAGPEVREPGDRLRHPGPPGDGGDGSAAGLGALVGRPAGRRTDPGPARARAEPACGRLLRTAGVQGVRPHGAYPLDPSQRELEMVLPIVR